MIVLGIILILVGALVFYFLGPEPFVRFAGGALVLAGVLMVIVGAVHESGVHLH